MILQLEGTLEPATERKTKAPYPIAFFVEDILTLLTYSNRDTINLLYYHLSEYCHQWTPSTLSFYSTFSGSIE